MSGVAFIALSVFRESVRDKVFYNLVLFSVVIVASSFLIGQLTAGQDVKIIKDLGLAATAMFGLFLSVFIGIGLVSMRSSAAASTRCSPSRSRARSWCSASTAA